LQADGFLTNLYVLLASEGAPLQVPSEEAEQGLPKNVSLELLLIGIQSGSARAVIRSWGGLYCRFLLPDGFLNAGDV